MKEPEYRHLESDLDKARAQYLCRACGCVVLDRALHNAWHEEQSPKQEYARMVRNMSQSCIQGE